MYIRRYRDDTYEYISITTTETEGFTYYQPRYVARYLFSSNDTTTFASISGSTIETTSYTAAISGSQIINENFTFFDIETRSILQCLFLVEYATYNSQQVLGYGTCVSSTDYVTNGICDSLGMKSGCLDNENYGTVIYRGVENIFGYYGEIINGVLLYGYYMYIFDKDNYNATTTDNCSVVYASEASSNYIDSLTYCEDMPILMLPASTSSSASSTSYITDYYTASRNAVLKYAMTAYTTTSTSVIQNGLFRFYMYFASGGTSSTGVTSSINAYRTSRFVRYA